MKKQVLFILAFVSISLLQAQTYQWILKQSGTSLGKPICLNNVSKNDVYYGSVDRIYKSTDRGETFSQVGTPISGSTRVKTMFVSKKDPNIIVVAVEASPLDLIVKTTNGGQTWVQTRTANFSYFGVPVTEDPKKPDTLYTMDGTKFLVSKNFGSTWDSIVTTVGSNSAPCDIEVFPDSTNIILVGDNGTGIFRSTDFGKTWANVHSTSGEIPTIACDPRNNGRAYATRWGGGGGFLTSTDYGRTWTLSNDPNVSGKNMWGVDVAPDDPNVLLTGEYSGGKIHLSKDGGRTFTPTTISGSNYAVFIVDTSTMYAAQGGGFYKLKTPWSPIPVELTSFISSVNDKTVLLEWSTATETNNSGFSVQVSTDGKVFDDVAFIQGYGTTTQIQSYSFTYTPQLGGTYYFRLKQIDYDGTSALSGVTEATIEIPETFTLEQNYPNPFNPSTTVAFVVPEAGYVVVAITDISGKEISKVFSGTVQAGRKTIQVNGSEMSSGIYFYTLRFAGVSGKVLQRTGKMALMK